MTDVVDIKPHLPNAGSIRNEGRRLMDNWWEGLSSSPQTGQKIANVFVMGSLAEVLRTFDIGMSFPEIAALQTAVKKKSMDYLLAAEDHGYSPDICGYVKVDVGLHLTGQEHPNGHFPTPDMVVATNMCNTYIKWSEIWERMYGIPVFVMDLPGWRGTNYQYSMDTETFAADRRYVEGQIRDLIELCEEVTGKSFDIDRLREIMAEVNKLSEGYQKVMKTNQAIPAPYNALTDGVNFMGIANTYRGSPEGSRFMEIALAELEERVANGIGAINDEQFRLLLVGTACYSHFRRFVELFEEWGGVFVASEYMSFAGGGIDRGIHYNLDRPIESLAEQILFTSQQSMSGIFHSHEWLAGVYDDWSIDGICYHGVKSCRTVSTGLPDTREYLMKNKDIPGLFIQSDLVDSRLWSDAQLKNRIDAFFEALESRRIKVGR